MRNPTAIPNARTHIPISNGGQLQIRERKNSGYQLRGYKFNGPFSTKKGVADHNDDNDDMSMSVMMTMINKKFNNFNQSEITYVQKFQIPCYSSVVVQSYLSYPLKA